MLVRRDDKRANESERHWLLFNERDEFARPDSAITAEAQLSVATGRDLDEIAAAGLRLAPSQGA